MRLYTGCKKVGSPFKIFSWVALTILIGVYLEYFNSLITAGKNLFHFIEQ